MFFGVTCRPIRDLIFWGGLRTVGFGGLWNNPLRYGCVSSFPRTNVKNVFTLIDYVRINIISWSLLILAQTRISMMFLSKEALISPLQIKKWINLRIWVRGYYITMYVPPFLGSFPKHCYISPFKVGHKCNPKTRYSHVLRVFRVQL